jgi:hypothetical protein
MTHLLWFLLGIILLTGIILLFKKAIKEGKKSTSIDDLLYSKNELSPENMSIMKAYRIMHLRGKLVEIEQKRVGKKQSEK